jgi:hypothetical protein
VPAGGAPHRYQEGYGGQQTGGRRLRQ